MSALAVGLVSVVLFALAAIWGGRRLLRSGGERRHWALFVHLCHLHHLDRNSRSLLRQAVVAQGLRQPARVFTEPQWLDVARLPAALRPRAADYQTLRALLFDL